MSQDRAARYRRLALAEPDKEKAELLRLLATSRLPAWQSPKSSIPGARRGLCGKLTGSRAREEANDRLDDRLGSITSFQIADIKLALGFDSQLLGMVVRSTWMESPDNLSSVWEMVAKNLHPKRDKETNRRDR
jgi:hypothetical protein